GSLRSYLLAQTHGRSVDLLRADTSRRRREERDVRQTAEAGYDLEHQVWDLAVAERVHAAVSDLPELERRAIELAYFCGRPHLEVVALLANTGADAPEGLWDRIAVELDAGAPPLDLAPVVSLEDARAATDRIVGRSDQRPVGSAARAGRRIRTRTAAVIGAVA